MNGRNFTMDYYLTGDVFAGMLGADFQGKKSHLSANFQILKSNNADLKIKNPKPQPFKSKVIELKPEDYLILCSPGLLQRQNPGGAEFGAKNIIKAALSQKGALAIRQNILFQANQFAGSAAQRDQTLLIMEVKDRILKLTKTK